MVKIADFGLARQYNMNNKEYSEEVVTLWYRAPELLLGERKYSTPIDIWSIGCIFAEIVSRKPLFKGDTEIKQLYHIFSILGTPDDSIWSGVSKLKNYQMSFPKFQE